MPAQSVRWSLRVPWSAIGALRTMVDEDRSGRIGEVLGRACCHLLEQPACLVVQMARSCVHARQARPSERTQVCSVRIDTAVVARVEQWLADHPEVALSWLIECAIRTYAHIHKAQSCNGIHMSGMAARRYRRLTDVVVIVDDMHAA
jgi:hypothetical protein